METRGRKPVPDTIKKARGTLRKDRARPDAPEAQPLDELPPPPEWLGEIAAQEWRIKTGELRSMKILAKADLTLLAALCNEWETYQRAEQELRKSGRVYVIRDEDGEIKRVETQPGVRIAKEALEQYRKISAVFGFSPADRQGIRVQKPERPAASILDLMKGGKAKTA